MSKVILFLVPFFFIYLAISTFVNKDRIPYLNRAELIKSRERVQVIWRTAAYVGIVFVILGALLFLTKDKYD